MVILLYVFIYQSHLGLLENFKNVSRELKQTMSRMYLGYNATVSPPL
jgi:hypothetical protein